MNNNDKKHFYITTTLPYVNAPLHMGHALEFIRADAIARYKKLAGYEVFFNTGTDEHGAKIYTKATEAGLTAQEFVDRGFVTFKEQITSFGVSNDIHFIRTTDEKHIAIAQDFWRKVRDNGYIYKKVYQSKYCIGCESEKTDSELEDGFCPLHPGIALEYIDEENYFFKYSVFGEKILELYEQNPEFVVPGFRLNEMREFVKRGLQDFSISRIAEKMPWGIPVPDDETQVMYVWFDALTSYISTLAEHGTDTLYTLTVSEKFQKFWTEGTPTQYCGKDNTRFQSIMWQAMLFAAGIPNSNKIVVNGFITGDGGVRMSKTLGNVVDPRDIVNEFGTDALRYFLLAEVSNFEDSPFTMERFKEVYNAKLANGIGNLTSRLMNMIVSYEVSLKDLDFSKTTFHIDDYFCADMEKFDIKNACDSIFNIIALIDQQIQAQEPFKKIKINPEEARTDLIRFAEQLKDVALMLRSILPSTAETIFSLLKENKKPETPLFLRKE